MLFYRYQNSDSMERTEIHPDLLDIYEDYILSDKDTKTLAKMYHHYLPILRLRDEEPERLFKYILQSEDYEVVEHLCRLARRKGVMGWSALEMNKQFSVAELVRKDSTLKFSEPFKYLALYEGEPIFEETKDWFVFKPTKLLEVWTRDNEENKE